jgi:DNA-binding response OmpR family regulator
MNAYTILIVDDDLTIREVVRRYLELDGFAVIEAENGPRALELLTARAVDLVLLDIMLPGLDGLTITRVLRTESDDGVLRMNGTVPIIMLTSRGEEGDRIAGLHMGADDYVVKPFSPREVVARVRAVLRRAQVSSGADSTAAVFGALRVDPRSRTVSVDGRPVELTVKEFDLLWLFCRHPGQVFTREQILSHVWGYSFYGDESTVTVHIRRLREKIEANPSEPGYIHTVWGVGYKFDPA